MMYSVPLLLLPLFTGPILAQTSTECDPTKKSCPADKALGTSYYSHDFTKGADDDNWKVTAGKISYTDKGAEFTVAKRGDAPTIQSKWYMFFGSVSFTMRSAPGTGIVSSAILESDDLDEIDWEWLGGEADNVQTNYFSKGDDSSYDREVDAGIPSGNAQTASHNYTIHWTKDKTEWLIDSNVVRTLNYKDVNDAYGYPQTPMNIRIGIWAGGDPDNAEGTIEWAGGKTDYTKGPYSMIVEKVEVVNYAPADKYEYGDKSGTYESIVVDGKGDGNKSKSSSASASASASASGSASASASSASKSHGTASSGSALPTTTGANATHVSPATPTATATTTGGAAASASAGAGEAVTETSADMAGSLGIQYWTLLGAFLLMLGA